MGSSVHPELCADVADIRRRNAGTLTLIVGLVFTLLATRLFVLQVWSAQEPRAHVARQLKRAAWRHGETLDEHPHRAEITDRHGRVLAESWYASTLVIDPAELARARPRGSTEREHLRHMIGLLSIALHDAGSPWSVAQEERFGRALLGWRKGSASKRKLRRLVARRGILPDVASRLREMLTRAEFRGWRFEQRMTRSYPYGRFTSQLLGVVGEHPKDADGRVAGRSGLEYWVDQCLEGRGSVFAAGQDRFGREFIEDWALLRKAREGARVELTIDAEIQRHCLEVLEDYSPAQEPKSSSCIVLDARSGEILAACSWPSAEPGDLGGGKVRHLRLGALADRYQPGSSIKPLFVAWALHTGAIRRDEVFDCGGPKGYEGFLGRRLVREYSVNPEALDHRMILVRSSNVGAVRIGLESLGLRRMFDALERFRVEGPRRMVAYPEAPSGKVPVRKRAKREWAGVSLPMGYQMTVSLLALARLYLAFANAGEIVEPTLVKAVHGPRSAVRPARRRLKVLPASLAAEVLSILGEVVTHPRGTGTKAQSALYPIAGKSGTAKTTHPTEGVYYDAFFCGIAPADAPRVVVCVVHHKVRHRGPGTYTGGSVSGPAVRRIIEGVLPRLGVPPRTPEPEHK